MKIALSLLSGIGYGGITYFRNLIPALARAEKSNVYHIFLPKNHELLSIVKQNNFMFHTVSFNTGSSLKRFLWEQFIFPLEIKRHGIDILFTAKNGNVLFAPCKTVISIRNVEPLCFQQYKNDWKLNVFSWLRRMNTLISARKADRIVAVSEAAKNRLTELIPQVENKVDIVYNGNPYNTCHQAKITEQPISDRYILSASKFVTYANQLNLIKGYAILTERMKDLPPLWLAGGVFDKKYFKEIQKYVFEYKLDRKIIFLGLVSHKRLSELYQSAYAFIFPSTLEACPQTLIEAMDIGLPIATSVTPPMPEICQQAAVYFNPYDPGEIAEKLEQILINPLLRENLQKNTSERVRFFSWDKSAEQLIRVFEKVLIAKTIQD